MILWSQQKIQLKIQYTHSPMKNIFTSIYQWKPWASVRWINPKTGQYRTSPDAGWKNLIGQQPVSNSSVSRQQLLINECGVYCWRKKTINKRLSWLIQTISTLRLKPKLLRCKNVNIVTFNVRTLNIANQLPKLIASDL